MQHIFIFYKAFAMLQHFFGIQNIVNLCEIDCELPILVNKISVNFIWKY